MIERVNSSGGDRGCPLVTIFIPTYNRGYCLAQALDSVAAQSLRDLEILVVDDGSTDDTADVIENWRRDSTLALRYLRQENQGKHVAHNTAVAHARGELFITLDSDDSLVSDAVEKIRYWWDSIPTEQRPGFAGVAGLCLNEDGSISGEPYPQEPLDASYLEIHRRCKMNGERREALRVDVLRRYPYPVFRGERHVRPTLILRRMGHELRLRFTNAVLEINRHAPDGISANRFRYRMRNPCGLHCFFLEEITLHDAWTPRATLRRYHKEYVRFALHCGLGFRAQWREVTDKGLWLLALPAGTLRWLGDRAKRRLRGLDA